MPKKNSKYINEIVDSVVRPIFAPNDQERKVQNPDPELVLLCIQAVGLTTLIEEDRYVGTISIFKSVLKNDKELTEFKVKEKMQVLKASCDALIAYSLNNTSLDLFIQFYRDYQYSEHPALRALAVESLCKMLLSFQLAQNLDQEVPQIRSYMMSQLIIQYYDNEYTWSKESEMKKILSCFFKSVVLFSEVQHELVYKSLNLTVFAVLQSLLKIEKKEEGTLKGSRKRVEAQNKKRQKKKKRSSSSDSEDYEA